MKWMNFITTPPHQNLEQDMVVGGEQEQLTSKPQWEWNEGANGTGNEIQRHSIKMNDKLISSFLSLVLTRVLLIYTRMVYGWIPSGIKFLFKDFKIHFKKLLESCLERPPRPRLDSYVLLDIQSEGERHPWQASACESIIQPHPRAIYGWLGLNNGSAAELGRWIENKRYNKQLSLLTWYEVYTTLCIWTTGISCAELSLRCCPVKANPGWDPPLYFSQRSQWDCLVWSPPRPGSEHLP